MRRRSKARRLDLPPGMDRPRPGAVALPVTPTGDAALVCPHCQVTGQVTTKADVTYGGISGSKATAGFLTAGLSLPFLGLAKRAKATELHCSNCGMTWQVPVVR